MLDRLRENLLAGWAGRVASRPGLILAIALGIAAAAIVLTALRLEFQSDRNALISEELEWNRKYIEYRDNFEGRDRIVVIVRVPSDDAGVANAQRFVDRLASALEGNAYIARVWSRIEADPILVRLLPLEQFHAYMAQIAQAGPLLESESVTQFLIALTSALRESEGEESTSEDAALQQITELRSFIDSIGRAARGADPATVLTESGIAADRGYEYIVTPDGKYMVVDIDVKPVEGDVDPYASSIAAVRTELEALRGEMGVEAGLTGIPVIEADETLVSMRDSTIASIIAFTAIAVLLIVAFRGWAMPVLSVAALLVGVAWSFGFLTLAIGHLQVLSVVFTVILLGLGIDFAIHLVTRYELVRGSYGPGRAGFAGAMRDTLVTTGPGIITGAITTAAAFSTTMFTDFQGMAEMGLIAGVGVILCMIAVLAVLPALMGLFRYEVHHVAPRRVEEAERIVGRVSRRPWITLGIVCVVVGVSTVFSTRVGFDYNLLNMMPREMDSVRWIDEMESSGQPVWDAVTMTSDIDEARELTRKLRQLESVREVGGIGWLFPPNEQEKVSIAATVRESLGERVLAPDPVTPTEPIPEDAPAILKQQLGALRFAIGIAINRADVRETPGMTEALGGLIESIDASAKVFEEEQDDQLKARISAFQIAFRENRSRVRAQINRATQTRPLSVEDFPPYLKRDAVASENPPLYLIKTYPRQDVWDPENLDRFLTEVRGVAGEDRVIGSPVQIHESGKLMEESYKLAGMLAVGVVLLLVFIDFFRPLDAALSMLPVSIGFVLTLGAMWLVGYSINPANLMVLPLMFGIGVASGVHMLHRYRQAPNDRPHGLVHGTGKAIVLTSLTTIIAFSSMLMAQHRGIRSLGFVLAVGITMTLFACLFVLPSVLELRSRFRARRQARR